MSGFTKCPECVKQLVEVPLREKRGFMECPFCESIYGKILLKNNS